MVASACAFLDVVTSLFSEDVHQPSWSMRLGCAFMMTTAEEIIQNTSIVPFLRQTLTA
ncbi:hypothetical protein [Candidatus Finniella inopinata]|uniref:hypothetical protein n=1 Tax=Candidatus Finniella inopinata TaxID=1696036 RepID=UPI0013EEC210|nr:hypothetical protein [Candidatus Finniella inopinata]